MSNQDQTPGTGFGLSAITRTGEATMAAVILILILFVYLLVLYLRKKRYVGVHPALGSSRARRLVFATTAAPGRALDPAVISSLAVTIFHASDFDERLECAVCLSELADGEKVRLLPKCKHAFHMECIDMWFGSNSTCPLCRIPVGIANSLKRADVANCSMPVLAREEVSRQPTSEEMMVIEMPSSSSRSGMEDGKAPALTSLRSLGRILSRGSMGIGLACSPRRCDIEQGGVEGAPPVSVSEAQTSSQ